MNFDHRASDFLKPVREEHFGSFSRGHLPPPYYLMDLNQLVISNPNDPSLSSEPLPFSASPSDPVQRDPHHFGSSHHFQMYDAELLISEGEDEENTEVS